MVNPDTDQPHPARVYDYLLGGACNFAADRAFADKLVATLPGIPLAARINRAFLRRAVQVALDLGIDQFLDLGSGIPTVGNTHEVAPGARVLYVDSDPIAVAHSRDVLAGVAGTDIVAADVRDADTVLTAARELIDFDRPVAVLAVAVLHFLDDARAALAPYRAAMAPGSVLAVTHATRDAEDVGEAQRMYAGNGMAGTPRTKAEVTALFDGLTLLPPGVVWTSQWRPEVVDGHPPSASLAYAAVGRITAI